MPYKSVNELPDGARHVLPRHAQEIYKEAFNSAYQHYRTAASRRGNSDREETAHKIAWNAVKQSYERGDDGKWHAR
jgi:cation transport regulator